MSVLQKISEFITDVFNAIVLLIQWIGELANRINAIDFSTSGITKILGTYRYLVGDTIYLIHISAFYIGLFLIAFRTIPIVVSWWKKFSPFHS